MSTAIGLYGVSFAYDLDEEGGEFALKDVTLEIEQGSFVAVVGHNGSGKSTFARLLNGLLVPVAGRVKEIGRAHV